MNTFEKIITENEIKIETLEKFRQEQYLTQKKQIRNSTIFLILFAVAIGIPSIIYKELQIGGFIIFLGIVTFLIWLKHIQNKYISVFKNTLLTSLSKNIDSNLNYQPIAFLKNKFKDSKFENKYTNISGEDYFHYKTESINMEMSDLVVTGRSNKVGNVMFKGVFMVINSKKKFSGRTVLIPESLDELISEIRQIAKAQKVWRDKVYINTPSDLNRYFTTYSSDFEQTASILNNELCQYLTLLSQARKIKIYLSVIGNKIYIGLSGYSNEIFPVDISNQISRALIKSYYDQIKFYLELAETINDIFNKM